jgi:hypothetical protein
LEKTGEDENNQYGVKQLKKVALCNQEAHLTAFDFDVSDV